MYKIIKDGVMVGITTAPTYIKMQDNGCFGLCSREEAQGIAFDGKPYSLRGRAEMDGLDTAVVEEDYDATVSRDHMAAAQVFVAQVEAGAISENTALEHKGLFDEWQTNTAYAVGAMRQYNGMLYKCLQGHTSQEDWTPDATPALWVVVDVSHAGTVDDPIPYSGNMELLEGMHYSQDGVVYVCTRSTGQAVYHTLAQLVGIYVEAVE